jgi:hypothetical protein
MHGCTEHIGTDLFFSYSSQKWLTPFKSDYILSPSTFHLFSRGHFSIILIEYYFIWLPPHP